MTEYKRVRIQEQKEKKILLFIIFGLFIVIGLQSWGWSKAPDKIMIHYPPDLRSSQILKIGEIPYHEVWTTTSYIMTHLYFWEEDGLVDFEKNRRTFFPFITENFSLYIKDYIKDHASSLEGRRREMRIMNGTTYDESKVKAIGDDAWIVWLDFRVTETLSGIVVSDEYIRYPVRVVKFDIANNFNPFGYALDGFLAPGPMQLVRNKDDS